MHLKRRLIASVAVLALAAGVVAGVPTGAAAVPPTGQPTLIAPEHDAEVGSNPVLRWSAVPGAVKYRVQVSTVETFASTVFSVDT